MVTIKDNLFTSQELDQIKLLIATKGYTFGWKSNLNKEYRHWNCHFAGGLDGDHIIQVQQTDIDPILWNMWTKINHYKQKLIRIYSNAYTYGTEGAVHRDADNPRDMTHLIYLNEEWNIDWGGETVFVINGEIEKAVIPKYGRLIIFPGNIYHAARSVSKFCPVARQIIVFKGSVL